MMSHSDANRASPALQSSLLSRHKHSVLLCALVALLLLSPTIDDEGAEGVLLSLLFTIVLVVGTIIVSRVPRDLLFVLTLSSTWLYLTWLHPVWSGSALDEISGAVLAACTLYMAIILLVSVAKAEKVDHDVIGGAIAVYLLMGIAWTVIFVLIEGLYPGSFSLAESARGSIWDQLLYFSFATLTTLGYGDVAPLTPIARIWAVLEAVCGTLFLAVLISRLVGLYKA
ncbi:MAG: potassium channel family protein [Pseudomonadota bacterium]